MLTKPPERQVKHFLAQIYPSYGLDLLIGFGLAILGGVATYQRSQLIHPILRDFSAVDVWFESDIPRVFANMTSPERQNYRAKVHPLFTLITYPIVHGISQLGHVDLITATQILNAMVAGLWLVGLFALFRLIGCRRLDAVLFSILAGTSAAAMFWFVVPETYPLGSLTIVLALISAAVARYYPPSVIGYVLMNLATLSITITNWMAGILATIVTHSRKQTLIITSCAVSLVLGLWFVQNLFFQSAAPPVTFQSGSTGAGTGELRFLLMPESGGLGRILPALLSHSLIMPDIAVIHDRYAPPHWSVLSVQQSLPGSGSVWGAMAVGLWLALLSLGVWQFLVMPQQPKFRLVLGLTLLGQLGLHWLYGNETFLYSLHIIPLLVVIASFSSLTRTRPLALVLTSILILCVSLNNLTQFNHVNRLVTDIVASSRHTWDTEQSSPSSLNLQPDPRSLSANDR